MLIFAFFISIVAADLEIAPYTVIKEHAGWEEREMPALKWITTRGFCDTPHGGESYQSFYRLFDYIDGANSESVKIPMTAPVSHYIIPGDGPECVSNFTMSFFIPMDFQDNPPEPTDADVFIEQRAGRRRSCMNWPGQRGWRSLWTPTGLPAMTGPMSSSTGGMRCGWRYPR